MNLWLALAVWLALALIAHEWGHALAAQALRLPWHPVIDRHGIGIHAGYEDVPLTRPQVIAFSLGGPLASLLYAVCMWQVWRGAALVSVEIAVANLVLPRSDGANTLRALRGLPYREAQV